jgi:hypothetical protein
MGAHRSDLASGPQLTMLLKGAEDDLKVSQRMSTNNVMMRKGTVLKSHVLRSMFSEE